MLLSKVVICVGPSQLVHQSAPPRFGDFLMHRHSVVVRQDHVGNLEGQCNRPDTLAGRPAINWRFRILKFQSIVDGSEDQVIPNVGRRALKWDHDPPVALGIGQPVLPWR